MQFTQPCTTAENAWHTALRHQLDRQASVSTPIPPTREATAPTRCMALPNEPNFTPEVRISVTCNPPFTVQSTTAAPPSTTLRPAVPSLSSASLPWPSLCHSSRFQAPAASPCPVAVPLPPSAAANLLPPSQQPPGTSPWTRARARPPRRVPIPAKDPPQILLLLPPCFTSGMHLRTLLLLHSGDAHSPLELLPSSVAATAIVTAAWKAASSGAEAHSGQ